MSTESQLWTFLNPRMLPYGRIIRVENASACAGTPDLYYNLRGHTGWIEGKHLDSLPEKTPINIPTLTIEQVNWLEDEAKLGGRSFLLLRGGRMLLLFDAIHVRQIFNREMWLHDAYNNVLLLTSTDIFKPAEFYKCLSR